MVFSFLCILFASSLGTALFFIIFASDLELDEAITLGMVGILGVVFFFAKKTGKFHNDEAIEMAIGAALVYVSAILWRFDLLYIPVPVQLAVLPGFVIFTRAYSRGPKLDGWASDYAPDMAREQAKSALKGRREE
jgi:uncharacterized membrane protein (UPF0136 family)